MTHTLFAIGPLQGTSEAEGRIAYFLYPGIDGVPALFGNSLADVLPRMLEHVPLAEITAEPALAQEAESHGMAVAPLTPEMQTLMGSIALDLAAPEAFAAIEDDDLLPQFVAAAAEFQGARPERWPEADRSILIRFDDAPEAQLAQILPGPGLCILSRVDIHGRPISEHDIITRFDGLACVFATAELAVEDVLARAFGVQGCPEPFVLELGRKRPVTDAELARLAAALSACARLAGDPGAQSLGTVTTRKGPLRAAARRDPDTGATHQP